MTIAVKAPRRCALCGRELVARPKGRQGRQAIYCARCRAFKQRKQESRHHAERVAALKYVRAHGIDALAWQEMMMASGEGCPGCGEPTNNADGRRCGHCAGGQEP